MQQRNSLFSAFYILFLDSIGFALIFPLFPALLLDPQFGLLTSISSEGGRHMLLGMLLIAFPIAQFAGAPFFGNLSDRFGRKKILCWTLIGTSFGYTLTALGIYTKIFSLIILSRLLTGFFSGTMAICLAVLADLSEDKKIRGRRFSIVTALLGISWIIAIIVATQFSTTHPSYPLWGMAILNLSSLIILWKLYSESFHPEKKEENLQVLRGIHQVIRLFEFKQLRVLFLTLFFWFLGYFISLQWAAPLSYVDFHATKGQMTWLYIYLGIFWTLSGIIAYRWLITHSSLWKITLWTLFFSSLFFFFTGVTDFFLYFRASYILAGIFSALTWTSLIHLIASATTVQNQGKSFGITQAMLALSQVIGPILGGIIAGFTIKLVFFVCALLLFTGFLLLLVYVVRRKNRLLKN